MNLGFEMLRKRSRTMASKQSLMAGNGSIPSPTSKYTKPTFFNSPRLFTGFSSKIFSETEAMMSPTSILDIKPFSGFKNPFASDRKTTTKSSPEPCLVKKLDSRGIGLGIVDVLIDEETNQKLSKSDSRMVLFGSQLKIQIPPLSPSLNSPTESPKSPSNFGHKTHNSPSSAKKSPFGSVNSKKSPFGSVNSGLETPGSPRVFTGCLSASEMESSEDYTCVITHGPNPRTTHIFDDCIVKNCCGVVGFSVPRKESCFFSDRSRYKSENFLSFCYTCKKNLGQGKDIYIYRGEKAFCSCECRSQEIMFDEGMENPELR